MFLDFKRTTTKSKWAAEQELVAVGVRVIRLTTAK